VIAANPSWHYSPSRPNVNRLRWQIIMMKRGGIGRVTVVETYTGSESGASARAAYYERIYRGYYFTYRLAR
jgi:hypothetical protein